MSQDRDRDARNYINSLPDHIYSPGVKELALDLLDRMTDEDIAALERLDVFGDTPPKPSTPEEAFEAWLAIERTIDPVVAAWADERDRKRTDS